MQNLGYPISPDDRACFFGLREKTSILGALQEEQIETLLSVMEVRSYDDQESVFLSGDPACAIYIVLKGKICLDFGEDNHPLSDIEFSPGECFGETSVIGIQPHSATATAAGPVRLITLSSSSLYTLYASDTALFAMLILNVAREASRRLHQTDSLFLSYLKK